MASIASFSGLASGIQWQDMVDKIMELETARRVTPYRNLAKTTQARGDAWRQYQGLVTKFKTAATGLKDGSALNVFKTTATKTASGQEVLSASASTQAAPGSYRVEVAEVARAEKASGDAVASTSAALNLSGQFFVNGRAVQIDATDSLAAVRDKINAVNAGSSASGVTATILSTSATEHRLVLTADQTGSRGVELVDSDTGVLQGLGVLGAATSANASPTSGAAQTQRFASTTTSLAALLGVSAPPTTTTISVGGKKITVDLTSDTLLTLQTKIAAAGGSSSIVEESVGGRTLYRLSADGVAGADGTASDPAASQRIAELLGFTRRAQAHTIQAGSDARFRVDGFAMTRRTNTVSDAIAGVTLNLLAANGNERTSALQNPVAGLSLTTDPKTIDPGTYAIAFQGTTSTTTATDDSADLAVSAYTNVPDGTYDVSLTTSTSRSTSASTGTLSVSASPNTVTPGTYAVAAAVSRSASATSAFLSATAAGSSVAAGTYAVNLAVSRSASASTGTLQATAAGSSIAAGTYSIGATFSRTASTSSPNLSVAAASSTIAAGTYAVNVTAAATRSSVTGTTVNATYTGNTGDSMTIKDNVTGITKSYSLTAGQTLDSVVSGLNSLFAANGMKMLASNSGNTLKLEHTDYGTSGSFTVTNSVNRVANAWGVGTTSPGTTYANGTNVAGTIGGVAATGTGQTLTGSGAYAGLQVGYTGTTATSGSVTVTDTISAATIGGVAATWNSVTQTLTRADGFAVRYTGSIAANNLGASSTATLGSVTLADAYSGGDIGGQAASWNAATQTLTRADGLAVRYTGSVPAGSLGGSTTFAAGNVTLTDTVTGGTLGGQAATWDAAARTFTAANGLVVSFTGTSPAGSLNSSSTSTIGSVTITDTQTIAGGTIGGEAATWNPATQTLTADAGTTAQGLAVTYTGAATSGSVATVTVSTSAVANGVTIDGEAADWDQVTGTIRGRPGSRFAGLALTYTGSNPSGFAGNLVVQGDIGVDLEIARDVDGAVKKVKDFASAYSELRGFVDRQRSARGPLASDTSLRAWMSSITGVLLDDVSGATGSLTRTTQAGVTLSRTGQLEVNDATVRSLLESSPADMQSLLTGLGSSMWGIADGLDRAVTGAIPTRLGTIDTRAAQLERRATDAEQRLERRREQLVRQFSAMEAAMSKVQSQGTWLSSQLSSLSASS